MENSLNHILLIVGSLAAFFALITSIFYAIHKKSKIINIDKLTNNSVKLTDRVVNNLENQTHQSDLQILHKLAYMFEVLKRYSDVVMVVDQIEKQFGSLTVNEYTWRGMCLNVLGHPLDAVDDFNEALKMDPSDANNFFTRGICYSSIGEIDEAKADFEKAVQLEPDIYVYQHFLEMNYITFTSKHKKIQINKRKENAEKDGLLKRRIKSEYFPEFIEPSEDEFAEAYLKRLKEATVLAPNDHNLKKALLSYHNNPRAIRKLLLEVYYERII